METPPSVPDTLTYQQKEYVRLRGEGLRPTPAARAAGFKHPDIYAFKLEKHPLIVQAIQAAQQATAARHQLKRDDIIDGLMDAVHAATTATELVMAWREIGKLIGAYDPIKVEIKQEHVHSIKQLENLGDADLLKLAEMDGFTIDGEIVHDEAD